MRKHGPRSLWKHKFVHTTDSKHALPISPNVLNRQFNPARPNQAWVADITYIRTRSGWLYLAVLLDLFARKVVGWAMAHSMHATLVCKALWTIAMVRCEVTSALVTPLPNAPVRDCQKGKFTVA